MGSVRRNVRKEWFLAFCFCALVLYPTQSVLKENIRAIPFGLNEGAVVFDGGIEITCAVSVALCPRVLLADPTGAMNERFVKPALFWLVGIGVPQMPFAENPRSVTGCFQHFGNRCGTCLLYTSPSPRDKRQSRMPSSA